MIDVCVCGHRIEMTEDGWRHSGNLMEHEGRSFRKCPGWSTAIASKPVPNFDAARYPMMVGPKSDTAWSKNSVYWACSCHNPKLREADDDD